MDAQAAPSQKHILKARIQEFVIPPVRDSLVLGKDSPIGCVAIRKALELLGDARFTHIEIEDEVVGDLIVRQGFLGRIPKERLIDFVLRRVKPLMGPEEIVQMELGAEIWLEEET